MPGFDSDQMVCAHCGAPVDHRYGDTWTHSRTRRAEAVCKKLPEPVARAQFVQRQEPQAEGNEGGKD